MTDISIIGTGCLIVALVIAAGIVIWQRRKIAELDLMLWGELHYGDLIQERVRVLEAAEAKRQAQRIAAAKKGRATQTARALAKKAAGQ